MDWVKASLTVFYNGQFWVALVEREDESGLRLARHVFGPEPGAAELKEWIATGYERLKFVPVSRADFGSLKPEKKVNPKRAKREAARQLSGTKARTRAQEAMRIIQEMGSASRKKRPKR
jgi:hypothetical protein